MSKLIDSDPVNPSHYMAAAACIQPIDVLRGFPFNLGNAFKYMFRAKYKRSYYYDMKKALYYLDDYYVNKSPYSNGVNTTQWTELRLFCKHCNTDFINTAAWDNDTFNEFLASVYDSLKGIIEDLDSPTKDVKDEN